MTVDLPPRPFLVRDALERGVRPGRLRSGLLHAPVPGVRMDAGLRRELEPVCRAVQLALPARTAFSHSTAAALWGLPLPFRTDPVDDLHVVGSSGPRPVELHGLRSHSGLVPSDLTVVRGIRVTVPDRTWADLGALAASSTSRRAGEYTRTGRPAFDPTDLVVVTDALLRGVGARTPYPQERLAARAASVRGQRGVQELRRALAAARHHVDSPMETRLRLRLVASGFPCPVVGADVFDDDGRWLARPDLSWPQLRIAIEYDGHHHLVSQTQRLNDVARQEELERLGWRVIVLLAHDVLRRWPSTEGRVLQAFYDRGVRPSAVAAAPDALERPRVVTSSRPR